MGVPLFAECVGVSNIQPKIGQVEQRFQLEQQQQADSINSANVMAKVVNLNSEFQQSHKLMRRIVILIKSE